MLGWITFFSVWLLDDGGRFKRKGKPCCFYNFPHGVAFSVPLLLGASFLPLNGEHSIPPPCTASPLPHGTEGGG